jgi:hypothetical protein
MPVAQQLTTTDMHATLEELLEAVFSARSVPRLYKYNEDQLSLLTSSETAVSRVGGWCEMASVSQSVSQSVLVESESGVDRRSAGSQLRVAVAEAGDSSGTPRKGERPLLKAVTKQRSEDRD